MAPLSGFREGPDSLIEEVLMRGRTTYIFHERDDNLALCPISHFLALAFTDDAFDSSQIRSVERYLSD